MVHFIDHFLKFTVASNDTVRIGLVQSDTVIPLPIPLRFTKPLFNTMITPNPTSEASRKRTRDVAPDEEELIEGSGLFVKRPHIPECPDTRKWILKNMNPPRF